MTWFLHPWLFAAGSTLVAYILTWCDLAIGHRFVSQAVVEDFIGADLVG